MKSEKNHVVESARAVAAQWVIGPEQGGVAYLRRGLEAELVRRWYVSRYGDISWVELGAILGRDRTCLPGALAKFAKCPLAERIGEAEEQHRQLVDSKERQLWLGSARPAGGESAKGPA